jgi:hypothetical protein
MHLSSKGFVLLELKGQCHEILCFRFFFHESSSPKLLKGSFQIFLKILGDIPKSRCTSGINDTSGKFATGINGIGFKFFHWYHWCCRYWWQICAGGNNNGSKLTAGVNNTCDKLWGQYQTDDTLIELE